MRQTLNLLRWPIALAIVAFASYVWSVRSVRGARSDIGSSAAREMRMMPVRFANGIAGRSIVPLATGDCVVLHVPPRYLTSAYVDSVLQQEADGRDLELRIHQEPLESRWHVPENDLSQLSTFNCASFAFGDVIGLTKSDWLELRPTSWTKGLNPTALILESQFNLIATLPWSKDTTSTIEVDVLTPGDVVLFVAPQGYCHIGRVSVSDTGNTLVSKLGVGPLVRGSITATADLYDRQVTAIQIYRRRGAK